MSTIIRSHRGYSSTMSTTKKNIILAEGELFIEIPDNLSDDNQIKFKVGDGVTTYENLPYASDTSILNNLSTVATSGSYTDLSDLPSIPSTTSDLTNDSDFITSSDLPTKVSDLTNDTGFITSSDLPTATSDLTNDSGFITNVVNNLVNYYLKSETYNKTEIDSIVTSIKNSRFEVVASLPTTDIETNVIYLVPKSSVQTSNAKDEYINLDGTTTGWEKIGDTEIDLSDYVDTSDLNTALANYTTTTDLTTLLAGKQNVLTFDNAPTQNSDNPVKSGGVYTAIQSVSDDLGSKSSASDVSGNDAFSKINTINESLSSKQDTLIAGENITIAADGKTISATGGGHTILDSNGTALTQEDNLQFIDSIIVDDSTNGKTVVRSSNFVGTSAQWNALSASEQEKYTSRDIIDDFNGTPIDSTPTQGSTNAVSSGGVYSSIQTLANQAENKVLYFTGVTCSATTGDFVSYSNNAITADHVLAKCVFDNSSAITTDVTWATASGSITLNGTCTTATTVSLLLIKKDN